jgi:hypothetical protein
MADAGDTLHWSSQGTHVLFSFIQIDYFGGFVLGALFTTVLCLLERWLYVQSTHSDTVTRFQAANIHVRDAVGARVDTAGARGECAVARGTVLGAGDASAVRGGVLHSLAANKIILVARTC